jgi:hypothetical protein
MNEKTGSAAPHITFRSLAVVILVLYVLSIHVCLGKTQSRSKWFYFDVSSTLPQPNFRQRRPKYPTRSGRVRMVRVAPADSNGGTCWDLYKDYCQPWPYPMQARRTYHYYAERVLSTNRMRTAWLANAIYRWGPDNAQPVDCHYVPHFLQPGA